MQHERRRRQQRGNTIQSIQTATIFDFTAVVADASGRLSNRTNASAIVIDWVRFDVAVLAFGVDRWNTLRGVGVIGHLEDPRIAPRHATFFANRLFVRV